MVKKEYFIFVNGDKVMVSKEVYLAYWQHTNRENYLERLDRQNKLLFFSDVDHDGNFVDNLADKSVDVEKLVETKEAIENLHTALSELNDEEREIINALYFREETIREVADIFKISHPALIKRKNKILEKLKTILKDF
ncbi:sigma-70 family RNA polymerase sigma factor [Enterococcus faecalis]|nr:sigma-70 family RNA polymerase sigma factor [Enterococcus faecalis]EGO8163104.1 sigma-70 family RNA polymerase sigma factor [Enterococcus faecalis]